MTGVQTCALPICFPVTIAGCYNKGIMATQIGGTIVWNLDVDDSKFQSGLNKAKSQAESFSKDVDGSDFVGKEVEFVGGEFLGLLVEMELERLGEFLFRVSRRGVFFAEADELLSYVAAFDSARDALREELESEGDKGCVLAAEDSRALEVGEGLRE